MYDSNSDSDTEDFDTDYSAESDDETCIPNTAITDKTKRNNVNDSRPKRITRTDIERSKKNFISQSDSLQPICEQQTQNDGIKKIQIPKTFFKHIITFDVESLFSEAFDGTKYIKLSTIVNIITEGGSMSLFDKIKLEIAVNNFVTNSSPETNNNLRKKIIAEVDSHFKNGKKIIEPIKITAYGREDLYLIIQAVTIFLEQQPTPIIVYPYNQ